MYIGLHAELALLLDSPLSMPAAVDSPLQSSLLSDADVQKRSQSVGVLTPIERRHWLSDRSHIRDGVYEQQH